ncbi:hypothetical protein KUTeg_021840 [Tegillarca granosa]|uniref:Neurotransmitter-gated ion-channel ligand-binding domain-containing protein n=1 Tax=Tegillarca granosa TaxID=220873 RepID=A0ABQ9E4I0_TEGGR|nr:hypothetical protein KUTeg_021840 [Tegillarca granosa]
MSQKKESENYDTHCFHVIQDIKDEVMETSVYFGLMWYDSSISDLSVIGDKNMFAMIYFNGYVVWVVGKIDETHCDCDVTYYPFDTQTCGLTIIVIGYTTQEVALLFHSPEVGKTFFSENGEWEFMESHTVTDDRIINSVTLIRQLRFMLKFRRRPLFQFLNSLLPVTMLSVLTSLIFKLPAESGEKIGFCLTVLLAFAVYRTNEKETVEESIEFY